MLLSYILFCLFCALFPYKTESKKKSVLKGMGEGLLFQSGSIHQFKTPLAIGYVPTWESGQVQTKWETGTHFFSCLQCQELGQEVTSGKPLTALHSLLPHLLHGKINLPYLTTERTSGEHRFL